MMAGAQASAKKVKLLCTVEVEDVGSRQPGGKGKQQ